ncbi:MAG TPA: heme o synthase [Gemmatimonadota bacterium]|nr:heme o synthase [Gemmatimonadota bacterium]
MTLLERVRTYAELGKPGISLLATATAAAGYLVAWPGVSAAGSLLGPGGWRLAALLAGTLLAAAGTNALNQLLEREHDARMARTRARPLPSGRLSPGRAAAFVVVVSAAGIGLLAVAVNLLAAGLAALTLASYAFVYTPMKRVSPAAVLVGSVPGALPVMGGWAAATGSLAPGAWALFAIVFLWQLPHFAGLDWMCREDYRRGGYRTVAVADGSGRSTAVQAVGSAALLVAAGALPAALGLAGGLYLGGALLLGGAYLAAGLPLVAEVTARRSRRLFLVSLAYLPLVLGLLVADRLIGG